jgi:hypothetical protein
MAKKLTKKINSQFYPTYFDSVRMLAEGGGIDPVSMLASQGQQVLSDVGTGMDNYITNQRPDKANLGSAFFSNFLSGGMGVQGAIKGVGALINRKQEFDAQQEAQRQAQLEAIKKQRLGQLGEQQQYAPTFAMGGNLNPSEIAKGTKEEMEHTSSKKMSRKTAMDHLKEDPKYYTKLKKAGLADSYARGGMLNSYAGGGNITKRISEVNSGTTHEQSPIGGVPITQEALVEDGEFLYTTKDGQKYVFTNRF